MASDGTTAARLLVEVQGRGITETAGGLGRMDQAVRGTTGGIGGLVRAAGGIYAVKKAFDATIGSAISWESEFAGVEKTVDATAGELASLEGELLQMHRTMPVARADLAGIAEAAGALGIESESIAEFTETVAQIGATTNVSSDQAANALGKLSNVLHLTEDDFDNFGAALVDLGNKGASTEQEILGIAERAGAGASLIDMAADATLGWSAAVANLGIEAEAGGSALQRFFLEMTTHVASAGDELDAIAQTAGMTADEFTRAFGEDSSAALQAFIGGMEDLTQAEQLALLEMLGFSDVRISRTLLGLAGDTENLNDALEIGSEAWAANTALVEEYGKRADTTASKIEVLGNRIGDLGRRVGEAQGGPVDWIIGAVDASVAGWEKNFLRFELDFGDHSARVAALAEGHHQTIADSFFGNDMTAQIINNITKWGTGVEETITMMEQGLTPALIASGAAWETYTTTISDALYGTGGAVGIVEQGVTDMSEDAGELPGMMADEMLANQFVLTDATTELVNFMEQAISPAQEMMNAQGFLASQELQDGLNSGIPSVVAKAEEMRDEALAVLASGNAFSGGASLLGTWVDGMSYEWNNIQRSRVLGMAGAVNRIFGQSLPTDGPLAGGVTPGGVSIVESWFDGMLSAFSSGMPQIEGAVGDVGAALGSSVGGPSFGTGTSGGAGGGNTYIKNIEVNVEGAPLNGSVDELVRVIQAADSVTDWADV